MPATDIAFAAVLLVILLLVAIIDFRTMLIPNALNIALGGTGLAYQTVSLKGFPVGSVAFMAAVFGLFWLVRAGYRHLRGAVGLGLGDVKMAAGAAAWFSPWNLPLFLLAASLSALAFMLVSASRTGGLQATSKVPFGPFIGFGLGTTWLLERAGVATFIPYGAYQ